VVVLEAERDANIPHPAHVLCGDFFGPDMVVLLDGFEHLQVFGDGLSNRPGYASVFCGNRCTDSCTPLIARKSGRLPAIRQITK
jgi:hypothetical protein